MAPAQALAHREHPAVRAAITTYIFTVTVGVGGTPSSLGGPWLPQLPLMSVLSSPRSQTVPRTMAVGLPPYHPYRGSLLRPASSSSTPWRQR